MIRNIVFDMGNVMIRFDPNYFMDRDGITDPSERKLIMNELFLSVEWAQMDAGTLTEQTAEQPILARFPEQMGDKVRHLLYNWSYPRDAIPGMEELVRKLEERGYVRRTRSTEDERVVMITLPDEGRALKEEAAKIPLQVGGCVSLSPEEAATLHSLLYKILETV